MPGTASPLVVPPALLAKRLSKKARSLVASLNSMPRPALSRIVLASKVMAWASSLKRIAWPASPEKVGPRPGLVLEIVLPRKYWRCAPPASPWIWTPHVFEARIVLRAQRTCSLAPGPEIETPSWARPSTVLSVMTRRSCPPTRCPRT